MDNQIQQKIERYHNLTKSINKTHATLEALQQEHKILETTIYHHCNHTWVFKGRDSFDSMVSRQCSKCSLWR